MRAPTSSSLAVSSRRSPQIAAGRRARRSAHFVGHAPPGSLSLRERPVTLCVPHVLSFATAMLPRLTV
jgi:hypothetical protein